MQWEGVVWGWSLSLNLQNILQRRIFSPASSCATMDHRTGQAKDPWPLETVKLETSQEHFHSWVSGVCLHSSRSTESTVGTASIVDKGRQQKVEMVFPIVGLYPRYSTHSFWFWACNRPTSPWHFVSASHPANLWFPAACSPVTTGHHEISININIHQPKTWQATDRKAPFVWLLDEHTCWIWMRLVGSTLISTKVPNQIRISICKNASQDHTLGDRIFKQVSCIEIHYLWC